MIIVEHETANYSYVLVCYNDNEIFNVTKSQKWYLTDINNVGLGRRQ